MKTLVLILSLISLNAFSKTICFGAMDAIPDFELAPAFVANCDGQRVKSKTEFIRTGKKQEERLEAQVLEKLKPMGYVKVSQIGVLSVYEKSEQATLAPHCLIRALYPKNTVYSLACSKDGFTLSLSSKNSVDVENVLKSSGYEKIADTERGPLYRLK